ncbi:MAG: VCBS repeat-containing protein [Phycisphaerales bacterium]|nr:VCBS repeat-containing protein [Phycisphaerales bacterium]
MKFPCALAAPAAIVLSAGASLAAIPFDPPVSVAAPQRPSTTAIADFDGDLDLDLAVTTDTPDKISFFLNDGSGVFTAGPTVLTGGGTGPEGIAAHDLDGDGDQDLVVVLQNINTARVFVNNGAMTFAAGSSAPVGSDARGLYKTDLNGAGGPEFLTANRDDNTITVISATGLTLSSTAVNSGGIEPRAAAAGDLDGDGDNDVAVTNHDDPPNIVVFSNTGGALAIAATIPIGGTVRPNGIDIGNVDGDTDNDLVVTVDDDDQGLNFVRPYLNNGAFSFTPGANLPTGGSNPDTVVARDLDLDGDTDIAVTNQDSGSLSILENTGAGAFAAAIVTPIGTRAEHIAIGTLDANATPDIVVTARDANAAFILLNDTVITPPPCPADFNGDNAVTSADITSFLNAWFADLAGGTTVADFNASGATNSADITAFLAAWFAALDGTC